MAEALLNGLWQGFLLASAVSLILRLIRAATAATRYGVWLATLVVVIALPWLPRFPESDVPAAIADQPAPAPLVVPASAPLPDPVPRVPVPQAMLPWLAAAWIAGAAWQLFRILRGYRQLENWKRNSSASLSIDVEGWSCRPIAVRISPEVSTPLAAGLRHPAILLPEGLAASLSESDLRHVLAHEVAHLRRADDWTQLLQKLLEALFFFHPAVRWIGRQLDLEREIACDDCAAETGGARKYAACLVRLAEHLASVRSPNPGPALAAVQSRNQLHRRMTMLLNPKRNRNTRCQKALLTCALAVCTGSGLYLAQLSPLFAVDDPYHQAEIQRAMDLARSQAEHVRLQTTQLYETAHQRQLLAEQAREEVERTKQDIEKAKYEVETVLAEAQAKKQAEEDARRQQSNSEQRRAELQALQQELREMQAEMRAQMERYRALERDLRETMRQLQNKPAPPAPPAPPKAPTAPVPPKPEN